MLKLDYTCYKAWEKLLIKAVVFAEDKHRGQTRKSSSLPYIMHPFAVAQIVSEQDNVNTQMIIAALLHDCQEDCKVLNKTIEEEFCPTVAKLVDELTDKFDKDSRPDLNRKQRKALELERLSKISDQAKVIKLADRLHNIRSRGMDAAHMFKNYIPETNKLLDTIGSACPVLADKIRQEIHTFIQENS